MLLESLFALQTAYPESTVAEQLTDNADDHMGHDELSALLDDDEDALVDDLTLSAPTTTPTPTWRYGSC